MGQMTLVGIDRASLKIGSAREHRQTGHTGVSDPPGMTLQTVAEFFCSKKTCEQIVKPMIADLQFEYFDALSQKRILKARWIRVRYFWSFCSVLGMTRILKSFVDVWRTFNS
jgi:hypothetical protein